MIPHPKRDRILERFDIALLKLERGVNILKYTPVCLPELGKEFYGEEGISVGEKNQINLSFFWGGGSCEGTHILFKCYKVVHMSNFIPCPQSSNFLFIPRSIAHKNSFEGTALQKQNVEKI